MIFEVIRSTRTFVDHGNVSLDEIDLLDHASDSSKNPMTEIGAGDAVGGDVVKHKEVEAVFEVTKIYM